MKSKTNRQYLFFLVFFYFFIFKDYLESIAPILKYTDEFIAMCAIPVFFFQLRKRRFRLKISKYGYGIWVAMFLLLSLAGSLVYNYQPFVKSALPDLILCSKFWLALYVGQYMFRGFSLERYAKRIFRHVLFIVVLYTVLIIADWTLHLFTADIRYGMRSVQLFYSHPTVFAACCVFLAAICISLRNALPSVGKTFLWICLLLCLTFRSKAIGAAFAFVFIYYVIFIRKKKLRVRTFLLLIPIVLLIGWEQIYYYFFSSIQAGSARYQLHAKAILVANDHFPLGSGFGTFGSYTSTTAYSVLYRLYNLSSIHGLREGSTAFASDTFWPIIIAQSGWLGTISFLAALLLLFLRIQKLRWASPSYHVSALCILAYLMISTIAESAFFHPLSIPQALWIGYLFSQSKRSCASCPQKSSTAPLS